MRLSTRVSLGILALAACAALAIWLTTMHGILHPLGRAVFDNYVDEALFIAERVDAGEDARELGESMGIQVRMLRASPEEHLRRRGHRHPPLSIERGGRKLLYHPGPRNVLAIESSQGWIGLRRDLDLERPGRLFAFAVLLGIGMVALAAFWLGRVSTRPILAAEAGMQRIAEGGLDHRLQETGPPEIVRMARSFNRMADRIDDLLKSEKALLAGVSHELRTPLSRLRLEIELLRDQGAPTGRLDAMEGDLAELDGLIGQLLALSRMQLGETPVARETCDLGTLVGEASRLAKVEVSVHGAASAEVDPALMTRALVNLLSNAARYGAPPVEVRLQADRIVVRDYGPGVDETDLPQLFAPFFRAEASRAKTTGGLGLGLMLVAQVAALHGGQASARNLPVAEGGGLEVTLRYC